MTIGEREILPAERRNVPIGTSAEAPANREEKEKVQIRVMISKAMAAELARKAKLMNMSKASLCRLVWDRAHFELQSYLKDLDFTAEPVDRSDRIVAKNWKVLLVLVPVQMKKDLKSDAEKIGCTMSEYLRTTLEAFLKEARVRE